MTRSSRIVSAERRQGGCRREWPSLFVLAGSVMWICGVVAVAATGCGKTEAEVFRPVVVTPDDYKAWCRACESLLAEKAKGFRPRSDSFIGLADDLRQSKEFTEGICSANHIGVERFLAVCRSIGVACSVMDAEEMDRASARRTPLDVCAGTIDRCGEGHGDDPPPPIALAPQEPPPTEIIGPGSAVVARNVEYLRPLAPEVKALAERLFAPAEEGG